MVPDPPFRIKRFIAIRFVHSLYSGPEQMNSMHSPKNTSRRHGTALATILVVALAVRLIGLDWGLPHVYEEAIPLKKAWNMGGWGDAPASLNPHFFHYPSLSFYVQMAGQAGLYGIERLTGAVDSSAGFRTLYYTDPTSFYLTGRAIGVICALLTVWLAAVAGGGAAGFAAALLLALNVFHVSRSQMVEVDVPLSMFVMLALTILARVATKPSLRGFVLAGVAIGLATAMKYTGVLLVMPLVVAHLFAREYARSPWTWPVVSGVVATVVFFLASPYVVLDFAAFRADFALEQSHMQTGHFGLDPDAGWLHYPARLGGTLIGWPALALAIAGVGIGLVRRERWVIVALAFAVPYALAITSWSMRTDRYLLPILPAILLFATYGAWALIGMITKSQRTRMLAMGIVVIAMIATNVRGLPAHVERSREDSRTVALRWIESNIPPGSLVITEAYGPPLFGPLDFWEIEGDIRNDVYRARVQNGFRGVMQFPLFQAQPAETAPFYDLDLYADADVIVTTGSVRGRYTRHPQRYPAHRRFYEALDKRFTLAHTIPAGGTGGEIKIYQNPSHTRPFADRPPQDFPRLKNAGEIPPRWHAWFYYRIGLNFEAFGHLDQALAAYREAAPHTAGDPETFRQITYGLARTLTMMGNDIEVEATLDRMLLLAPGPADRAFVGDIRNRLK